MDGESGEEDGKHEEVRLVHKVKMEVYFWKERSLDLHGRGGRWTSKCDNIRGTSIIVSLKRDEIMEVCRLTGGENFVRERNQLILYALFDF